MGSSPCALRLVSSRSISRDETIVLSEKLYLRVNSAETNLDRLDV